MNPNYFRIAMPVLFLPFKLKANTTSMAKIRIFLVLFLPFKLKANTTKLIRTVHLSLLFLPFKLKANTTYRPIWLWIHCCFCLSN